ncbi:MAG: DUF4178 domain-containing protein [Thiobacillus sp.]|nr:DUF4178 domain-containing protein [Thiobacillus sp.]
MAEPEIPVPSASPAGRPQVMQCPVCGGAITLRAVGHSVNAACSQCGSLLDVAREDVKVLNKAWESQRPLLIPLGTRASLEGTPWEVIGYQERSSGSAQEGRYAWEEYLLFNPRHGFRFLAQAQGHWTLYRVIKSGMALPAEASFARFFTGEARVDYVLGEFYWRVKKGDTAQVSDSIAPPYILSVEKGKDETNTALGVYVSQEEIAAAFAIDPGKMPPPRGVAANQPSSFARRLPGVLRAALLATLVATAIQFAQVYSASGQQALVDTFDATTESPDRTHVSHSFVLQKESANVCLESQAVLNNSWAELSATLVNEATLERRNLLQGMEYYSGYDGGEHWSEGDTKASNCFSAVPGGQYRLVLEPDAGDFQLGRPGKQTFSVRVLRDTPIWSNWFALLLALLPYPAFLWLRHHGFEYARWSESDYMPEGYASIKNSLSNDDE